MLALGGAPTAAAVTALTISTTYPSVQVDPGGQVDLPILVAVAQRPRRSTCRSPARLTASRPASAVAGSSSPRSTRRPSSDTASPAPSDLKLRVEVPDSATPQAYNLTVHAQAADGTADAADHAHGRRPSKATA